MFRWGLSQCTGTGHVHAAGLGNDLCAVMPRGGWGKEGMQMLRGMHASIWAGRQSDAGGLGPVHVLGGVFS